MSEMALIKSAIPRTDVVKQTALIGTQSGVSSFRAIFRTRPLRPSKPSLLEREVIFFLDQGHLDDAEQERVARRSGQLAPELASTKGTMSILDIDSARRLYRTDQWHTDWSCLDA